MNWYKKAQLIETQWELKRKMEPLQKEYSDFLKKKRKTQLTPEEEIQMKKVGDELNTLGKQLKQNIEEKKQLSKELISQGKEYEVTPENFSRYHYTGFIGNDAYNKYRTKEGVSWLGSINKYRSFKLTKIH